MGKKSASMPSIRGNKGRNNPDSCPVKVFISYSHEDIKLCKELEKYLRFLQRQKIISSWYDRMINPGADWDREINAQLNSAHIILFLVSINFLVSDYIESTEMARAFERYDANEVDVIPVIIDHCDWRINENLSSLQALPDRGKPITDWKQRSKAFTDISQGIRRSVEVLRREKFLLPLENKKVSH